VTLSLPGPTPGNWPRHVLLPLRRAGGSGGRRVLFAPALAAQLQEASGGHPGLPATLYAG